MSIELNLDSSLLNFAVFGNPVKHSKSPVIHSLFAEQFDIKLKYQTIEVPLDSFKQYLEQFFLEFGNGLNITVPFKEEAYSCCDVLSERAKRAESVNTIWFDNDQVHGDTTDGRGLINDLMSNHQIKLSGNSILILGAGGSVKAILEPLIQQQPERITIVNRTLERARNLVEDFSGDIPINARSYDSLPDQTFDLIINATSLSLQGKLPKLSTDILTANTTVYDLMYSDEATVFMQWAEDNGAYKSLDGLGMLVEQAAEGFYQWHGVRPETKSVIEIVRNSID